MNAALDWLNSSTEEEREQAYRHLTTEEQAEVDRLLGMGSECETDRKSELARCATDLPYWLNTYGKTYDPRLSEPLIPFKLFPRQVEFLTWLREREAAQEDGLAEKSRDVGFTWLCCAYALHGWLFRPGFAAGFGSRKLALVDLIGDPDTIFEKVRILYRNLPGWMLPAGFRETDHDNHCRIINPANGATITGEGGDEIGRGGRKTIYFVDEAAFLEHAGKIEASLSQTTRCRIWVSTPNGPGNPFARKRFGGKLPVFSFHWHADPRKNLWEHRDGSTGAGAGAPAEAVYPWYEAEKARIDDPVIVAQEIDIDYSASIEGICIPAKWVRAAVELELPASGPVTGGLDIAEEGRNKNVLIAGRGPVIPAGGVVSWSQLNTTQTAHKAADEAERLGVVSLNYDCDGVGAGVKGAWQSTERKLAFTVNPIRGGGTPSETRWPDGKSSRERFLNLRAECWMLLRRRFERTYEFVTEGTPHAPEDLISIPNHPDLIAQLSLPLLQSTETGKIKLESKADMRKRGVASPDFADALAYREAPVTSWAQDPNSLLDIQKRLAAI